MGINMNVVTATAALESNLGLTPNTRFDDTGVFRAPGPDITNFGNARFGEEAVGA